MKNWSDGTQLTLGDIARLTEASLSGDPDLIISGAAPIESAAEGDITFVANKKYLAHLDTTKAGAVVLDLETPSSHPAILRHKEPYLTFARVLDLLYPAQAHVETGTHDSAVVDDTAGVDSTAAIGPLCHIKAGAIIGKGTQLVSSVFVGRDVTLGDNCLIYPGVCIMDGTRIGNSVIIHSSTVVGSDGFGFAESAAGLKKIKQVGSVEIEDDVEIGSNCSVDRGALGPTRIGRGTKIDNLVQIAHNVEIGAHSIIVAQVGISGSTKIGSGVILAGQAGLVGHIEIGDGARVAAQSGVSRSIEEKQTVLGSPAREAGLARRIEASLSRLPELFRRVRSLEKKSDD
ncbi:MAG: UDP-3-O-(3-hydroxymyristoyl)glucosamine N-acyltransferase [candidate division Zixibacteria bacterium]|nr:UDP-3-O-(3-hydroxymyristoyl)glucosamine N-acyltransferase [candidate division Zixibacteria bacterium]MDH3937304.1 UDP-3-O-(3-hydroxymyristoyl)glucosamine N-acyltransferase [candidate division Zixibacteria bacterium]MDH4034552.1 UDP-3-O-(3-hydroxymyristoyl)glucosamine N-acyltransferase [candidate division Zixibacteria bacterium]